VTNPITGIVGCCARAASGHATALLSPAINSLRRICHPMKLLCGAAYRGLGCIGTGQYRRSPLFAETASTIVTTANVAICIHMVLSLPVRPSSRAQGWLFRLGAQIASYGLPGVVSRRRATRDTAVA
jgi:hypothetical protein